MTQPSDIVAPVRPAGDPPANGDDPSGTLRDRGRSAFHPTSTAVDAGLFTWDIVSGEVECDPATYRMHGLPEDPSATFEAFLSRVPESDLPQLLETIELMTASSGTYQIEYWSGALAATCARWRREAGSCQETTDVPPR